MLSFCTRRYVALCRSPLVRALPISDVKIGRAFMVRTFSETACQKAEKEMMTAFQEVLLFCTVFIGRWSKQRSLCNAVHLQKPTNCIRAWTRLSVPLALQTVLWLMLLIESEVSWLQMMNRRLELHYNSNKPKDITELLKIMQTMKQNIDSRNDKDEALIERVTFANIALHIGKTEESGIYCREVGIEMWLDPSLILCVVVRILLFASLQCFYRHFNNIWWAKRGCMILVWRFVCNV